MPVAPEQPSSGPGAALGFDPTTRELLLVWPHDARESQVGDQFRRDPGARRCIDIPGGVAFNQRIPAKRS